MNRNRYKKGFTLIELLVVISIIALLSSILMPVLNNAKIRAIDSHIESEVTEFRNLMELDYAETKNYNNLQYYGWVYPCKLAGVYGGFAGNFADQAVAICNKIRAYGGDYFTNPNYIFFVGNAGSSPTRYSIMVFLPGKRVWLCVGSSGKTSEMPIDSPPWYNPGCYNNP